VDHQGEHFQVIELTESERRLDIEALPVNSTEYPKYNFGDGRPKVLCETRGVQLAAGEETCFVNLLLPNRQLAAPRRSIKWAGEGHILISGEGPALTVNARGFQIDGKGSYAFAAGEQLTVLTAGADTPVRRHDPPGKSAWPAGSTVWEMDLPAPATCLSPLGQGEVLVGCEDGSFGKVEAGKLTVIGKAAERVGAVLAGRLYGEDDLTYLAASYDHTLRLFGRDGSERLTVALPGNGHMPPWGTALCLADLDGDGKRWPIVGSAAWRVHAISPDGKVRWTFDTAAHSVTCLAAGDLNQDGREEIAVATVYFCVPAINADGGRLWEDEDYNDYWTAGPIFPFLQMADVDADGQLEVVTAGSDTLVHCLDHRGVKKWTRSIGDDPAGLVVTPEGIAAASLTGDLHLLDGQGKRVWRLTLGSPCAALAGVGEGLCVALENGEVVCVDKAGSVTGAHSLSAPAAHLLGLSDGQVVVATGEGKLRLVTF